LIINNFAFSDASCPSRLGAREDGRMLKNLFEQLGFEVELQENKTKHVSSQ